MYCKLELESEKESVLNQLHKMLTESLNELGFSVAEDLATYALVRTFTIIKTIKGISGDIIKKDRTTLIKNIQKLTEIENFLFNQLKLLPGVLDGRRACIVLKFLTL